MGITRRTFLGTAALAAGGAWLDGAPLQPLRPTPTPAQLRPVQELKGFTRIHLRPGEQRQVSFTVGAGHLRMLDAGMRWVVEPGLFRVMIGGASKDIRLRGEFRVVERP